MCGSKLVQTANSVVIDESDPLEIETSSYRLDQRSTSAREPIQLRGRDRRREFARESAGPLGSNGRTDYSSATITNSSPDIAQQEVAEEVRNRKPVNRTTGIGGPSFLGLGYEGSNDGFVYDKPRDDGFVYDSEATPPEYLLEEVPRGVSWRAWALFLLLLVGAGLGYVQWRASHHQGFPDVASILARNGPTVDPSGPDMRDNQQKAARKAQASDSSSADSAKGAQEQASRSGSDAATASESQKPTASEESADGAPEKPTKAAQTIKADQDVADENSHSKSAKGTAANASDEDNEESAKPESDGPVAKATRAKRAQPAPVEEPAPQPKPLGEKDPLIVQANRYLHATGAGKNCSAALNLLRQSSSAGNPSADVKMGALYWSGTCVTQSNLTAYQWFARAHSLEPNNRWIERSRSSLWASLTPAERRRVGY